MAPLPIRRGFGHERHLHRDGATVLHVLVDDRPIGALRVADEVRRQVDNFIELDALREVIGRPPREPRPLPAEPMPLPLPKATARKRKKDSNSLSPKSKSNCQNPNSPSARKRKKPKPKNNHKAVRTKFILVRTPFLLSPTQNLPPF